MHLHVALSFSLFIPVYHNFAFTTDLEIIFCGACNCSLLIYSRCTIVCGMLGSHSRGSYLLESYAPQHGGIWLTLQRDVPPPSAELKSMPSKQKADSHHSACCLFGSFFNPADGSRMFLQNATKTSTRLHGETPHSLYYCCVKQF